jgi:hypothetical protein
MCAVARVCLAVALACSIARPVDAQGAKSAALAKELSAALDAAKLDAIAAKDPSKPDVFFGALYFPGSQLLVVSAQYAAPLHMSEQLAKKNYREIYLDLFSASVAGTRASVTDLGANGLVADPEDNQPFDTYDSDKPLSFDGDWRAQKLSEEEYMKAFAAADERYSQILAALLAQVKKTS